ncbi:DUF4129 domain-containing protein [Agromyces sp. G08B096]|uniref:DUF4129 domain-containing protein n=1 Tax=Agromyces sp. G08B096 TaxID=3156399 RepID=A0AAU7W680_9MICO
MSDIPVDPDAPEARRWLLDELSRPEYREAEPTWFDLAAQAVRDWLIGLFQGGVGLPGGILPVLAVLLVVVLVVVGILVFGVPRLRRRRGGGGRAPLFDDADTRSLAELRRAADAAEAAGDYGLAIEERFRAVVRALVDRELVRAHPGTTAHGFAASAAPGFPGHASRLQSAADAFDAVRYLGRPGTIEEARALAALDRDLAAATPVPAATAGAVA